MRTRRAFAVAAAFAAVSAVHLLVGRETHALHVVHVVFGALYLLPVVAAALFVSARAAVVLSIATGASYAVHARTAWAGDPWENANQLAMAAVYVFVGAISAGLVRAAERERRARLELERRAQREALVQAVASLSNALRRRDDGTGAHSARVARIAVRIGDALGLPPDRIELLRLAGLVHDVGKIGVRDDVLSKPGRLTLEERERVERHPAMAADILRPLHGAEELAEIVLSHHECPDGSGYPRGLDQGHISVEAAILRVADVFDALVEPRPYKAGMAPAEAVARMRALDGKLDAAVLWTLDRLVADGDGALTMGPGHGVMPQATRAPAAREASRADRGGSERGSRCATATDRSGRGMPP